MDLPGTVARGLGMVGTARGRDTPGQFWPYAAAVMVGFMVLGNVAFLAAFIATTGASTGTRLGTLMGAIGLTGAMTVALLATAVARRLHDRGRSGAWGLVPLAALVAAFALQAVVLATREDDPGPGPFLVAFAAAVVYFGTLIALVVQLALPGRGRSGA